MQSADELDATVPHAAAALRLLSDEHASRRPAPDKWCAKEIIGHLIDSAANNHQRFVRARWQDDLVFPGYEQDAWVTLQQYRSAPWRELLDLWQGYNLHLARVMRAIPAEVRLTPRERHNLDEIGFEPPMSTEPVTLEYLMHDYVSHLKHHLRQLEAMGHLA